MQNSDVTLLRAPKRLEALRRSGLLDSPPEESFDRLTRLAARLLDAPVALVTLLDEDRQFFKSAYGLGEPWASRREMPMAYSFCQYAVDPTEPLVIGDARLDPRTQDSPAITENQSLAYAGVPLTREGQILGSLCVVDTRPRQWTDTEIRLLQDLAAAVQTEIHLRWQAGRQAEQAALLDTTHDSIIVRDLESRITFWNRGAEVRYGWPSEEALGQIPHELLQTRFPAPVEEIEAALLRDGTWEGNLVHTTRDGREIIVSSRWVLQRNAQAEPVAILETNNDVTDRVRVEADLRESERKFRQLFELSADGVFITERDGTMVDVNEAVLQLTGYTREEILRLNAVETYADPADRQRFREVLERDGVVQGFEVKVRRKDGSIFDATYSATVRRSETGEVLGYQGIVHDVTERKRAGEVLQASEERFRTLFDEAAAAVLIHDEGGRILQVNRRLCDSLGYTREELLRLPVWEIEIGLTAEVLQHVWAQMRLGVPMTVEGMHRRKNGRTFPVEVQVTKIELEGQEVILAEAHDVTERKRAEEALRRSAERLRVLHDENPTMLFTVGEDGITLSVNHFGAEQLGYAPEDLEGENVLNIFHPEDRDAAADYVRQCFSEPDRIHTWELRKLRRDGAELWVRETARRITTPQGKAAALIVCEDITDWKRAEEALERNEARFRSLIENASEIVTILDATGALQYESAAMVRVLGYPSGEIVGRSFLEFTHPEDVEPMTELFQQVIKNPGEQVPWQLRFRHKDGSYVWLEGISVNLMDNPAVEGIVANCRDVTERVETHQRLAAYSAELERSNRELQDFAYIASHDLQEPLRKVQAFGDRLQSRYSEALGETGQDYLERMQGAAGRMQMLIQELLAYSRITSKAQPPEPVDLEHVAREVTGDLSVRIEKWQGQVKIGALPVVQADPMQMRQLLQNLIGNGLKFHREGVPPVVDVSGTARQDGMAEIRVADNGIGFEQQYAERIFAPFERLHGRSGYEGTGMGLAICRKVVERHGGSITAESTPGEGTTFVIHLPTNKEKAL